MISVSNTFKTALQASTRLWKLKVTVTRNDVGAVPLDISDRVLSCDIDADWERRNGSASLTLDNFDYSLSPMNQSSSTNLVGGVYNPLLDSNHIIEIWEGLTTTAGDEWVKKFTGVLGDEIDADTYPGTVQITARDKSKLLQDTYIFQSKTYSPAATPNLTLAENVIQDMITTFLPSGGITLAVDDPTNYVVGSLSGPYTAKDINLWDAIQQISDAFNFSLIFDENGTLRLKKIIRDLGTVTPVWTFDESQITKDSMSTSDADVRNHVKLRVAGLSDVEKKNEASIARYGRRYFEVNRSMSNIISTAEQAHQFVDAILKDMSYVVPVDRIELPLFPIIQAGDIVSLVNTKLGTDATMYRYRVANVRDTFSNNKKRTTLMLHGYYAFNPDTVPAPKPITSFSGTTFTRTIQNYPGSGWAGYSKTMYYPRLSWTPPSQDVSGNAITADFGGYTIYRKGPSDALFYPAASVKSYLDSVGTVVNYWHDYTAQPGTNQYKITAINKTGKVSAESSVISVVKPTDSIT